MASITLKGNPHRTSGELPAKGKNAPGFRLTKTDLTDTTLDAFRGKRVVMNIFPSLETSVCSASIRRFNEMAAGLENTVVLAISKDLPFSFNRFCSTEGIESLIPLSAFRNSGFGKDYGVEILDGGFAGLFARSVVVLDEEGKVIYTQLVPEIGQEPDYEAALAVL